MRRIFLKLALFVAPFLVIVALFYCFEPSDYWYLRKDAAYNARPISKMRQMILTRPQNIVLGDSRMANFSEDNIREVTGEDFLNLGYGGATLGDSIDLFWMADRYCELERVFISVSFYNVHARFVPLGVQLAMPVAEKPIEYLLTPSSWFDTYNRLQRLWSYRENPEQEAYDDPVKATYFDPASFRDENGVRTDLVEYSHLIVSMCQGYSISPQLDRLIEMIDYCNAGGIEITVVIPPSHKTIWINVIDALDLRGQIAAYKERIQQKAKTYDFEWENNFSQEDDNFIDGFHFMPQQRIANARYFFTDEPWENKIITTPPSGQ